MLPAMRRLHPLAFALTILCLATGSAARAAEGGGASDLLDKGEQLFRQGDTAGALKAVDEAAHVDPKDARAPYLRGVALEKKGDTGAAMAAYRDAIARRPGFAEAHNNLGALLQAKGDAAGAVAELDAAVKANPSYAEAQYNLGIA